MCKFYLQSVVLLCVLWSAAWSGLAAGGFPESLGRALPLLQERPKRYRCL